MAIPRESAFMPTIKCSSCGQQVEISMMGDHICGGGSAGGEPSPPPFPSDKFQTFVAKPPPDKYGRMPPRVDTGAANQNYMLQGQLTPVSSSTGSGSVSPRTPGGRSAGGRSDDYFAPKIANGESTPSQGRRMGGTYGGLSDSDGYDAEFYPQSPKKQPQNLLQKMNTIAPGPFETGRRTGARNAFPREDRTNGSSRGGYDADRPGTSASNNSSNNNRGGVVPPRLPRKMGYGGFGPPGTNNDFEPEPFGANNRSETFPRPNDPVDAPLRTPSAPGPRPDKFRRPSNTSNGRRPSFGQGPDTSRPPPPPRKSLVRPANGSTSSINLADEFGIGNPYHTPSDSLSSVSSSYSSQPSQPSSRTSPARSRRKPSDTTGLNDLMLDLQSSMMTQPKELPPTPMQPPPVDKGMGSLRARDRRAAPPADLRLDTAAQARPPRVGSPLASPSFQPPRTPRTDRYGMVGRRGFNEASPPRGRRPDPALQSNRGRCKSCNEVITGKSISSADGRLSGRYHKACFVCTTCSEPFSSAEFYVLNDQPYCELHYHKLNGSLCNGCGRGIEGQYLEDEAMAKYHVGCFRCGDCGMSLSNGYFEVDGKSYCERDAWRRMQQPSMVTKDGPSGMGADFSATLPLPSRDRDLDFSPSPGPSPPRSRTPGPQPPMGLPGRGVSTRRPSTSSSNRPPQPFGLPRGEKLAPGMLPPPRPRMNKRMTRLGMM